MSRPASRFPPDVVLAGCWIRWIPQRLDAGLDDPDSASIWRLGNGSADLSYFNAKLTRNEAKEVTGPKESILSRAFSDSKIVANYY